MIVAEVWQILGFYMIILLTGLQSIPQHLYEAAPSTARRRWAQLLAHHAADAEALAVPVRAWSAS